MTEHYWITFVGDTDVKMCARCEERYPTDKPCTDAPLPDVWLEERVMEALAAVGRMTPLEARTEIGRAHV